VAGEGVRTFVVTARDTDGHLVGIVPLYLTGLRLLGRLRVRALRLLGDYHSGGEYGDWILESERETEIGLSLAQALAGARSHWDCLWMPRVAGWTGARERMVSACVRAGLPVRERPKEFSAVELPRDYREYWEGVSANARSAIQRQATKLDARREVRALRDVRGAPELHRRARGPERPTLERHGPPCDLQAQAPGAAFYRRFTEVALSQDWLRLFALKRATSSLPFRSATPTTAHSPAAGGFDPGTGRAGQRAPARVIGRIEEGITTYDFLGEYTEHKRGWPRCARVTIPVTHGARGAGLRVARCLARGAT
jgi:hypothetical protein